MTIWAGSVIIALVSAKQPSESVVVIIDYDNEAVVITLSENEYSGQEDDNYF